MACVCSFTFVFSPHFSFELLSLLFCGYFQCTFFGYFRFPVQQIRLRLCLIQVTVVVCLVSNAIISYRHGNGAIIVVCFFNLSVKVLLLTSQNIILPASVRTLVYSNCEHDYETKGTAATRDTLTV